LACIRNASEIFASNRVLGDGLLNEASLILPQLTLVVMVPTFVKFGQKLTEVVSLVVVVVVVMFELLHLAEICTLTSIF